MRVRMNKTSAGPAGVFMIRKEYDLPDEFADQLIQAGAAVSLEPKPEPVEPEHEDDSDSDLNHVGGGYYELPNGERIKGKDKAEKALAEYLEEQAQAQTAEQEGDEE